MIGQTRRERWEAALTNYFTRQPATLGSSVQAVTVTQAEQTVGTYVTVPLVQFYAWNRSKESQ
jgi:hypothetical protein